MTNDTQFVYSNSDPEAVTAFTEAGEAHQEAMNGAYEDAQALGKNRGLLVLEPGGFGGAVRITGLVPDDPRDPPVGWRYVKTRDRLEPAARGKTADAARRWLAEHQPGPETDARGVMAERGLPRSVRYANGRGLVVGAPSIEVLDGVLWARFEGGDPEGCTWERRRLSEYYAAKEAAEDAKVGVSQ